MGAIRPTRAEIDLGAVRHNAATLAAVAATPIAAVVKADAYGHGAAPVALALATVPAVAAFAVSLVEEGIELRAVGVRTPILVMGPSLAGGHRDLLEHDLVPLISDPADLERLAELGRARGVPAAVHLKVDTGMSRLGLPLDGLGPRVAGALQRGGLELVGLATHLADADLGDPTAALASSRAQLARFAEAVAAVRAVGWSPRLLHAGASAALVRLPEARLDLGRPGLALYGNGLAAVAAPLRPVMRLVSAIAQLRDADPGAAVGYGGLWRAARPTRLAVVPVGYADGYPRRLTGSAEVLIGGARCPVVGAISMDITLVDVTDLGARVGPGDEVVLLGVQGGERISAAEFGQRAGLTEYEVTCGISPRVPRVHLPVDAV